MPERKSKLEGNYEGLRGINVGFTKICPVGEEDLELSYRGYSIEQLAKNSTYEEVSYLLVNGTLPTKTELTNWTSQIKEARLLPEELKEIFNKIPIHAHPMSVLRTGVSVLGNIEPEINLEGISAAIRLFGLLPSMIGYWERLRMGKKVDYMEEIQEDTIAGYLLACIYGKSAGKMDIEMMDKSLILYAEHEYAASTFALRVCASTLADYYSCITTSIGTLSGGLNGGANEEAIKLILKFKDPDDAEIEIHKMLEEKKLIYGFGHAVYADHDPRSLIIKKLTKKLANDHKECKNIFEIAQRIEKVMWEEKKIFPNLDFYTAVAYYISSIKPILFTPIFVVSRSAGWAAHILEQRVNNKLIRPTAKYNGPTNLKYIPIEFR